MTLTEVHLLLQEALVGATASLLLLRGVALASLVAACRGLVASHQWIVEFCLLADSCEAADAEHVMTRLHWPIHAYELSLQPYVHDVHVDVHCVLAIWIHRLVGLRRLGRLPRLPEHHVPRMRWTHEILLLTALAIDVSLSSARRAAAAHAAAHLLSLHVLLRPPSVGAAALREPMTVSHAVILRLRQVVLAHHGGTQQTVQVFLVHAAHVWIHDSWIASSISVFDFVSASIHHFLAHT